MSTPTISGTAQVGQTLTASIGDIQTPATYQWNRGGVPIAGATNATYVISDADAGATLTVTVQAASPPTAAVTEIIPTNVSSPTISGTAQVGQTLTAIPGTWTHNPNSYAYQWADSMIGPIPGATSSIYVPTINNLNHALAVYVVATNSAGSSALVHSVATSPVTAAVPVNTALPAISGAAQVGATLTATTGTWTNSPTSFTYQWKRAGTPIGGATASTYVPVSADIGKTLTMSVTATNGSGSSTPATSAATSPVAAAVPLNTALPTISGTAQVGQTLTMTTGTWTNSPTSFTYQWNRAGTPIAGATASTYVPVAADVGNTLTVSVTAANSGGSSVPATSAATNSVTAAVPVNTVLPTISGTAQVGQTLTMTTGTWTNSPTSFTYQWNRTGTPIAGATASTYVPVAADVGNTLTVSVTAANSGGSSVPATSAATSSVTAAVPVITALPAISGTAQVGQTLTATNGTWTNSPTGFLYQWKRSGVSIGGATAATYVPVAADVGNALTVTVIASNTGGASAPATSAATNVVSAPSVLPSHFAIGLKSYWANQSWMPASGVPWDYRYQYVNYGWENWNSPSGAFITIYIQATAPSYIPVFDWYVAGSQSAGGSPAFFANLASPSFMSTYFTSYKLMLQKAGAFSSPVIVHIEPDMWSFMQQNGSQDPTTITVSVAGFSGLASFANNASGFAQALIALRNTYAPNVLLALDNSSWAVNYDPTSTADPVAAGNAVAAFYQKLAAKFDLIFFNTSDRDSGFKVVVLGQTTAQAWWTDTTFSNFRQYIGAIYQVTGVKSMLWQTPVGNTLYLSCNNTNFHYQDNRAQYFLQAGNRQHIIDYVNAGVIGVLFGEGLDGSQSSQADTSYYDQAGDGITNPPAINGNNLVSTYSDDDGGFMRLSAAAYYASPVPTGIGVQAPQVPANTVLPSISGTDQVGQTLTAANGIWTNSPTSFTYQWNRLGTLITGATASTYVPVSADIGGTLTVSVTATNSAGSSAPAVSVASAVIAASGRIFAPDTTSLAIIPMASMAVPAYLTPTTDPSFGNMVMRISDAGVFGGSVSPGVGSIQMIKHHYATDQAWNADESLIFLEQAKYPGAILDGKTYQFIKPMPFFTTDMERVWSNTNKDTMFGVRSNPAAFILLNINTATETTLASFPQYSWLSMGNFGGHVSNDDRYVSLMAQSGTSLVVFTYDIVNNVVVGSQTFANTGRDDNIRTSSVTPSGKYVVVAFPTSALGFPAGSLQLFDINMNYLRQVTITNHIDFIYDINGDEVAVGNKTSTGDIAHQYIYSTRLADARERVELPVGSVNNPTHTSCRNINRPGWAYFSEYANTSAGHPISYYNTYFDYNEIFAVKLDGSGTIERWAKEHHVTDPSFDYNSNDGYDRSAMAVPNRYGDRIIFASDWGDSSLSAFIHTYVTWWPG